MNKNTLILIVIALSFSGCELFEYHPYDGKITGETDINVKNIARIEQECEGKKSIRFALISDTQRHYDETEDFVESVNARTDIDFIIHAGDISDFALTNEFIWMRDIMNKLNKPYIVILGNHDCLANGEETFINIFGEVNFSFLAGNVKFVCLNTNALEFDYSRAIPDFAYITSQFNDRQPEHEKTVFVMHARPYSEQFNNNVLPMFQHITKQFPKLQFCLNGHDHTMKFDDIFNDGIMYYGISDISKRKYLLFAITDNDQYDYEEVEF